jgi:hypothetical protein
MKNLNLTLMLLLLAVISFAQVPSYVPTNGLVGWWPFNGNANDESGNGYNGSVYGATLSNDRNGNNNSAYSFDGISNFIWVGLVQQLNGSQTSSISYWINTPLSYPTNPVGNYGTAIGHWKHNGQFNGPIGITLTNSSDGSVNVALIGGQGASSNPSIINANSWIHICIIYDGNQPINQRIALYINGNFNQYINVNNSPTTLGTQATRTYIGAACGPDGQDDAWSYFNGNIDDVGMWNRALTQQEITDLYNANICYQTITVTDTLLINTGITGFNPVTYENTIKIWPNPTNDHITIDAGDLNIMNGYSIRITNSLGQQMFQSAINQQQFYLNLTTWTGNGIYYVNIIDPNGNIIDVKKIVIQ